MVSLHEGDISPRPPTKGAMVPSSEPKQVGDSFFQAENEASLIAHGSRYQYRVTSTTIRVESSGSPTHHTRWGCADWSTRQKWQLNLAASQDVAGRLGRGSKSIGLTDKARLTHLMKQCRDAGVLASRLSRRDRPLLATSYWRVKKLPYGRTSVYSLYLIPPSLVDVSRCRSRLMR